MASKGAKAARAKLRKNARRGRYARFSGSTTKFAVRIEEKLLHNGDTGEDGKPIVLKEDQVRLKRVELYVGPASLSRQVVNGSKSSVNAERMVTYFQNVRKKDDPLTIAELFGVHGSKYQHVWEETPTTNRLCIYSNELGRLDMYYHGRIYFFVEVDVIMQTIKRSREYGSPDRAKQAAKLGLIQWEETIPMK